MKLLRLPRAILFGALAFGVLLAIVAVSWSQGQGKAQADAGDTTVARRSACDGRTHGRPGWRAARAAARPG